MLLLVPLLCLAIFAYFKWAFGYWKRKGVPYLEPIFPTGNLRVNFRTSENPLEYWRRIYMEIKAKGHKHVGLYMFTNPQYVSLDPVIIRRVLCDDFNHFVDRGLYYNEKDNPISAHLIALDGDKWRDARKKLTPIFTSKRIKEAFGIVRECTAQLNSFLGENCGRSPLDVKNAIDCLVINLIGSSAFGLDCKAFDGNANDIVPRFRQVVCMSKFQFAKLNFGIQFPNLARFLHVDFMAKTVTEFFSALIKNNVEFRKLNGVRRDDFLQLLISLMDSQDFTLDNVTAHAFMFFLAGFETTTHSICYALYCLGRDLDAQEKLRQEIRDVLGNGGITYENLGQLSYMDAVISEALRMYPPLPLLSRRCVKAYKVPGTNLVIEKDTFVVVPVVGLHYDPEYYPDPDRFDPSRFSGAAPRMYFPFGEGPRNCAGARFGRIMVKSALAVLLQNYEFSLPDDAPLRFQKQTFALILDGGLWLNVDKIKTA